MSSSERIQRNVGRIAYGLLSVVLLSMVVDGLRRGDTKEAIIGGAATALLAWGVLSSRYCADWKAEMPPPSSRIRTVASVVLWLGVGTVVSFPQLLLPAEVAIGGSIPWWVDGIFLAFFSSPALALMHLEFLCKLGEDEKAKLRWGIQRVGPISAITYLLTRRE